MRKLKPGSEDTSAFRWAKRSKPGIIPLHIRLALAHIGDVAGSSKLSTLKRYSR
jgi:hypothetical protein